MINELLLNSIDTSILLAVVLLTLLVTANYLQGIILPSKEHYVVIILYILHSMAFLKGVILIWGLS